MIWRRCVMADFKLRVKFAKTGPAIWLSHLEVVRAMERCLRRSDLPCAISQGFSPHLKHSFSAALPVGTGSTGEYMDVDLESLVGPEEALRCLQAVQHENLPVLQVEYAAKDAPSLQVYFNAARYLIELEDPDGAVSSELLKRLKSQSVIEIIKKGKPKTYEISQYLIACNPGEVSPASTLELTMLSRPEGSLRPEVLLAAVAAPDYDLKLCSLTRTGLEHKEL